MRRARRIFSRSSSGFIPAYLFAGGFSGFTDNPALLSNIFTTYNGSTNITALSDLVGRIESIAGGVNLIQSTSASRVAYAGFPFGGITQLYNYPRAVSNAAWTKLNCTPTDGQASYDGTATATLLTATAAAPAGAIQAGTSYSSTMRCEVIAKAGTSAWLRIFGVAAANNAAWFDLTNGVTGTVQASVTAGIESVGSGWWRCWIYSTGTGNNGFRMASADGATNAVSGTTVFIADPIQSIGTSQVTFQNRLGPTNIAQPGGVINQFEYTRSPANAYWTKSAVTATDNAATAADGTATAGTLLETATTAEHYMRRVVTMAASSNNAYWVWVSSIGGRNARIRILDVATATNGFLAQFNLATGAVTSASNVGAGVGNALTVVAEGGGYWIGVQGTASTATSVYFDLFATDGTTTSYLGDITKGIDVWEMQFNWQTTVSLARQTVLSTVASISQTPTDLSTVNGYYAEGVDDFLFVDAASWGTASAGCFADTGNNWSIGAMYCGHDDAGVLFSQCGAVDANKMLEVSLVAGVPQIRIRGTNTAASSAIHNGVPHLVLLSCSNGVVTAYIDGTASTPTVGAAAAETEKVAWMARTPSAPAGHLMGRCDPFLIDRALSAAEAAQLWQYAKNYWGAV